MTLYPGPGINLICGSNAAGKTSLLEAIYLLGRARSFRTNQWRHLVERNKTSFQLVATLALPFTTTLGMKRALSGWEVRYGGNAVTTLTDLARYFPVLLLNPDSHRLIEGSPSVRRRFMDWGLFHFDRDFLNAWRKWANALRQRNESLRSSGATDRQLLVWEKTLASASDNLDQRRQAFLVHLQTALIDWITPILGNCDISLEYRRGWPPEDDLSAILASNRYSDRRQGYTRVGPQRADLIVKVGEKPASEVLSRGQQKLCAAALILTQSILCKLHSGLPCLILIDDLPAELDVESRERLLNALVQWSGQCFITAVDDIPFERVVSYPLMTKFRLKAGGITPVV